MAYSRWGQSAWYTYWQVSKDNNKRSEQVLHIDGGEVYKFTLKDLLTDIDGCLEQVSEGLSYTWKDLLELRGYMREFIDDVLSDESLVSDDRTVIDHLLESLKK